MGYIRLRLVLPTNLQDVQTSQILSESGKYLEHFLHFIELTLSKMALVSQKCLSQNLKFSSLVR